MDIAHERRHPRIALAAAAPSPRRPPARRLRGPADPARLGQSLIPPGLRRGGSWCGRDRAILPLRAVRRSPPRGRLTAQISQQRRLDVTPYIALPAAGTNRPKELRDLPMLSVPLRVKP